MFQISPGVEIREEDLSLIIPRIPISIGAYVGEFNWGPVDEIRLIDSTESLENVFGRPDNSNARGYFCAYNYLQYSQDLRAIRVLPDDADLETADTIGNAVAGLPDGDDFIASAVLSGADTLIVRNQDEFDTLLTDSDFLDLTTASGGTVHFVARYPGDRGNRLAVAVAGETEYNDGWAYADLFDDVPVAANNEFAVVVLLDGEPVETYLVSSNVDALDQNGQSMFADFAINNNSEYIYIVGPNVYDVDGSGVMTLNSDMMTAIDAESDSALPFRLGGSEYDVVSASRESAVTMGWNKFADAEDIDINFCITGDYSATVSSHVVQNVAETRKDCVVFISPPIDSVVGTATPATDIVTWRNDELNINSSYAVMDGNYKLQLDPFNRVYRWVPLNGDIAGLAARTSQNRDPWWSPGGLERGQIKNAVRLAFIPSKAKRDELYKNGVNIVTTWPGEGTVLWGDKTLLARSSAFDRINVRMLFIVIEKAIAKAARNLLFEFNDEFTRNRFIQSVEPYLRDVQGRRGIIRHNGRDGFFVIADERINTPEVIDRNEFRAKILIKPARSINFVTLTFAATRTGVEFEELIEEIFPDDQVS